MIKNDSQLKRAQKRLEEVQESIKKYRQLYTGADLIFYTTPLTYEEHELSSEIEIYQKLKSLPLEINILEMQNKSHLIDNIGELLTQLRLAAKLTQAQLAEQLGWEQSNLSRFESENYSSQSISKIVEFASALGIWLYVTPSLTEKNEEPITKAPTQVFKIQSTTDVTTSTDTDISDSVADLAQTYFAPYKTFANQESTIV
jgi:transcriptional regulator with XRE-family HTH domain